MAKAESWAVTKMTPRPQALDYPHHERAAEIYSHWMSGFTEEEIAKFFGLKAGEVQKDLQHVITGLPTRLIIAHNNDRARIMLQRQESGSFRRLMGESLAVKAKDFIDSGLSPASVLREYREATGLVQKAEPLLQINTQQNIIGGNGGISGRGITSAEDLIRRVLDKMGEKDQTVLPAPGGDIIEAEPIREAEDSVPAED